MRCPFEVVKQNMQIGAFKTTSEAVSQIYKHRGIRGTFRKIRVLCGGRLNDPE